MGYAFSWLKTKINQKKVLSVVLVFPDRRPRHLVPQTVQRRRELFAQAALFRFSTFVMIFVAVAVFVAGRCRFQLERVLPDPVHQALSSLLDVLLSRTATFS